VIKGTVAKIRQLSKSANLPRLWSMMATVSV